MIFSTPVGARNAVEVAVTDAGEQNGSPCPVGHNVHRQQTRTNATASGVKLLRVVHSSGKLDVYPHLRIAPFLVNSNLKLKLPHCEKPGGDYRG